METLTRRLAVLLLPAVFAGGCFAENPLPSIGALTLKPEVSAEDLKAQVGLLANEQHAGRGTGTDGARLAAEWCADYLRKAGLQPLPGSKGFFHEFEFNAGEKVIAEKNALSVGGEVAKLDADFRPLAFTENADIESGVVFAGYGLSVPEGAGQRRYTSFEGLDVKDKVVLLLRYVPEGVDQARRAHLNRYAGLRY
jgi:hypothetical protein